MPSMPRLIRILIAMLPFTLLLDGALAAAVQPVRSPVDDRAYELLTLDNGLRVVLVSDPDTDMAAAALNVGVGYYDDPATRPGLAHFLEHMLFLGTKKYPQPDAYREFITRHGGRINATTGAENTVYFFDIAHQHLEGALDRFSQFFIAPLFSTEYVQREMQAVEAEYRLRLRDDARRLNDAVKETINPAHPYAKFSTGNLETLRDRDGESARDAVIDFYGRHYSAERMTLAVIGREPLAKLRAMVEQRMTAIRHGIPAPARADVPLRPDGQGPLRLDVVPFKDQRLLRLEFAFPWHEEYMLGKPGALLSHLIGHEGAGSLHALLLRRGWITGVSAGANRLSDREGVFAISMELTQAGVARTDEIAALTFQYLALIAREGITTAFHDELARISQLNFLYREPQQARSEAISLAANLHLYPAELVLSGPYHLEDFDEATIRAVLAWLRPDNMRMTVVAPGLETSARSRYYDTPYRVTPITSEQRQRWSRPEPQPDPYLAELALPAANDFVPRHARLKDLEPGGTRPVLLADEAGLRIWHLQDREFRRPRADLHVSIDSAATGASARGAALTSLYLALVGEALTPYAYPAEVAGLRYDVFRTMRGFGFSISGYDENGALLRDLVIDKLLGLKIDPETFAVRRTELERQWRNTRLGTPYVQLQNELDDILYRQRWTAEEMLRALDGVTAADLEAFIPRLLAELRIEVFAHGNVTAAETRAAGAAIAAKFFDGAERGPRLTREVVRLERGKNYLRTVDTGQDDNAVFVYYQAGDSDSIDDAARVLMIEQLVKSAFFETLRTREQLGYVVNAQSISALRLPGLGFVVQSPAQGPAALITRIDGFLSSYRDDIAAMSDEAFERHRAGLVAALSERDSSMARRSQRLQTELSLRNYSFDRRERLAEAVAGLDRAQVLAHYDECLLSERRSRIVLQAPGKTGGAIAAGDERYLGITDIAAFRTSGTSYALPESDPGPVRATVAHSDDAPNPGGAVPIPAITGTDGGEARPAAPPISAGERER